MAKASYRDKYSIMMGSMDSGEPRAIAFSPDSTELWLTDEDGRKRTIPVAPPEPSVRELTTPNGADLTWDEAGRTEDGDWTEIQYEVSHKPWLAFSRSYIPSRSAYTSICTTEISTS